MRANPAIFVPPELHFISDVPREVDREDAEKPTYLRGPHYGKVCDTTGTRCTTCLDPGGEALDNTDDSTKSFGAGRKIVNSTAGDAHKKLVAAMDMYSTRTLNCTGSANIKDLKKAEPEPKKTSLSEESNDPRYRAAPYGREARIVRCVTRDKRRSLEPRKKKTRPEGTDTPNANFVSHGLAPVALLASIDKHPKSVLFVVTKASSPTSCNLGEDPIAEESLKRTGHRKVDMSDVAEHRASENASAKNGIVPILEIAELAKFADSGANV